MSRKKHVHKYHLVPFVNTTRNVWACALADCNHYMPEHMNNLMPGKSSICWNCGKQFQLSEESMKRNEPICIQCELKERGIDLDVTNIDELIATIGKATKENSKE